MKIVIYFALLEPKPKRKATNRLSMSGSDEAPPNAEPAKVTTKRKKSISVTTNKSVSSNAETNDESDNDKDTHSHYGESASRSTSIGPEHAASINEADLNEK